MKLISFILGKKYLNGLLLITLALFVASASANVITLENGQVDAVGGNASMDVILDSAPTGLTGYSINVTINDPSVAIINNVSFLSWATYNDNTTLPSSSCRVKAADVSELVQPGAQNIHLATITLRGLKGGVTPVTISLNLINDENDTRFYPTIHSGTFTVEAPVPTPVPLPGYQNPPTDPRHENLYGDLNANGRLDFNDLQLFFRYMTWIQENEPVSLFDYNHNGRIDFNDLQLLFREM